MKSVLKTSLAMIAGLLFSLSSFAAEISISSIQYVWPQALDYDNVQVTIGYKDSSNAEQLVTLFYCSDLHPIVDGSACTKNYELFKTYLSMAIAAKATNQSIWVQTKTLQGQSTTYIDSISLGE